MGTLVTFRVGPAPVKHVAIMDPEMSTLGMLLALSALVAATDFYAIIVQQRATRRRIGLERQQTEAEGLRGLVRVFLADAASASDAHQVR